ncbi:hypothetical protein C8R44DRAFT_759729 [Mycena epipterygia]|nr:hypothetical protein C8R44DRAFT_759729 [Mycena epipterygia]
MSSIQGEEEAIEEPDLPLCVLKDMSSFEFGLWDGIAAPFFQPFSLPKLKKLDIEAEQWPGEFLLGLHARSGFSLTRLGLTRVSLDANSLIAFLRVVPTLTTLSLKKTTCVTDRLLQAFTYDSSPQSTTLTLPLLTTLMLERGACFLDGQTVVHMVESLWRPDIRDGAFPSLTCIVLTLWGSRFDEDVEIRLAKIGATGFLIDRVERS